MAQIIWKYVKPLLISSAVEDFEKKNSVSFPTDLKACIKTNNGGRPSLNAFNTDKTKDRVFKTLLSFNEADTENIHKYFPIIHSESNSLVPFASDPGGNYLCLHDNRIVLFLHETGELEAVADSFSNLLAKLHD
jgi:hypothetical protein